MKAPEALIPAAEVQKKFGYYQDEALKRPVFISKNGRPKTVLVAYDEFVRLRERDRKVYRMEDLPDHLVSGLLEATVPEELEERQS